MGELFVRYDVSWSGSPQLGLRRFQRRGEHAHLQGLAGADEFQSRPKSPLTQGVTIGDAGHGREVAGWQGDQKGVVDHPFARGDDTKSAGTDVFGDGPFHSQLVVSADEHRRQLHVYAGFGAFQQELLFHWASLQDWCFGEHLGRGRHAFAFIVAKLRSEGHGSWEHWRENDNYRCDSAEVVRVGTRAVAVAVAKLLNSRRNNSLPRSRRVLQRDTLRGNLV